MERAQISLSIVQVPVSTGRSKRVVSVGWHLKIKLFLVHSFNELPLSGHSRGRIASTLVTLFDEVWMPIKIYWSGPDSEVECGGLT